MEKPFRGCQKSNITQGFHANHTAVDFDRVPYGTALVSPEKCIVYTLTDAVTLEELGYELKSGWGIRLKSLVKPNTYYMFWHCLPVFPVSLNDIVEEGQMVAQMGNSGSVRTLEGGEIHLELRNKFPFPGTHLHYEMLVNGIAVDPTLYLEWEKEIPSVGILSALLNILKKLADLIKGRK